MLSLVQALENLGAKVLRRLAGSLAGCSSASHRLPVSSSLPSPCVGSWSAQYRPLASFYLPASVWADGQHQTGHSLSIGAPFVRGDGHPPFEMGAKRRRAACARLWAILRRAIQRRPALGAVHRRATPTRFPIGWHTKSRLSSRLAHSSGLGATQAG